MLTKTGRVRFPSDIKFLEYGGTVVMEMSAAGATANMQEDKATFEAWALCLKAHGYENVELSLNGTVGTNNPHYQRFLYRALRFDQGLNWFCLSDTLKSETERFEKDKLSGRLLINIPTQEADTKAYNRESQAERWLVGHPNYLNDQLGTKIEQFFHQLPVGLFQDEVSSKTRVFPGAAAAIDIWGLDGNAFHFVELKIGGNKSLGVLSELFFYGCFMRDVLCKWEFYTKVANKLNTFRGFDRLQKANINEVVAHIFTESLHPELHSAFEEIKYCSLENLKFENYKLDENLSANISAT